MNNIQKAKTLLENPDLQSEISWKKLENLGLSNHFRKMLVNSIKHFHYHGRILFLNSRNLQKLKDPLDSDIMYINDNLNAWAERREELYIKIIIYKLL